MSILRNLYLLMAASAKWELFKTRNDYRAERPVYELSEKEKNRIHKEYENNMHDFNIHGITIHAKDRKTAIKIYARTHNKIRKKSDTPSD